MDKIRKGPGLPVPGKAPSATLTAVRHGAGLARAGLPVDAASRLNAEGYGDLADAAILRAAAEILAARVYGSIDRERGSFAARAAVTTAFSVLHASADKFAERAGL